VPPGGFCRPAAPPFATTTRPIGLRCPEVMRMWWTWASPVGVGAFFAGLALFLGAVALLQTVSRRRAGWCWTPR